MSKLPDDDLPIIDRTLSPADRETLGALLGKVFANPLDGEVAFVPLELPYDHYCIVTAISGTGGQDVLFRTVRGLQALCRALDSRADFDTMPVTAEVRAFIAERLRSSGDG